MKAQFIVDYITWETEIGAAPRVGDSVQLLKEGGAQIDGKVTDVCWILRQRGNNASFEHLRVDCDTPSSIKQRGVNTPGLTPPAASPHPG